MTSVTGYYYDGASAQSELVTLRLGDTGEVECEPAVTAAVPLTALRIESRVGGVARRVHFPDGGVLLSKDHDTLDLWLRELSPRANLVHRLESRLAPALASLVIVAVLLLAGAFWGVPRFSAQMARHFPESWSEQLADIALDTMDEFALQPTGLPFAERERISDLFRSLVPASGWPKYLLVFRQAGMANAFALPDGTIVITDELVQMELRDEELAGVFLHEIGHVEHRHSLRMIISHAGLAGLTFAIFGDVGAAGSLILGMPNMLMDASYSRDLEWEADTYALEEMRRRGIPPLHFAAALAHIEEQFAALVAGHVPELPGECPAEPDAELAAEMGEVTGSSEGPGPVANVPPAEVQPAPPPPAELHEDLQQQIADGLLGYLSTHPLTAERRARFTAGD